MFAVIMALCISFFAIAPANAMVPQVRMPEWQKTRVYISSWEPNSGKLSVCVELTALTNISEVSCKMNLENSNEKDDTITYEITLPGTNNKKTIKSNVIDSLPQNSKATFKKVFNVKPDTCDWLDINLRAKPDANDLKRIIEKDYANNPTIHLILKNEIDNIKNPIYIGKITPILARNDIAITSVKDSAPNLEKIDSEDCYFWYPETAAGKGFEAESLRTFSVAVAAKNTKNAETIGNILIKRLSASNRPLIITKSSGDSFAIPPLVAIDLIASDIATLKAFKLNNADFIQRALNDMKESDIKSMLKYNLAALMKKQGSNNEFQKIIQELKTAYPAWPLLNK